jgi:hypothetical protein
LSIFFTLNGNLLGELVLVIKVLFWILNKKYHSNLINFNLTSTIINGLINLNLKVGKFQSVPRWIASSQQ